MKKLIAANWKMNMSMVEARNFVMNVLQSAKDHPNISDKSEFLICAPFVYLSALSPLSEKGVLSFGAQDCSQHEQGAYTGEISAKMLKDVGCSHVIVGHSERRDYHNEDNVLVNEKAKVVIDNGLTAIVCIGESLREREANLQKEVVKRQLLESVPKNASADNTVIAYEPIWAIGTGKTPSLEDAKQMHDFIRELLKKYYESGENMHILYGGSMNPTNAEELLSIENIDGGLIGGAALKTDDYLAVAKSA